MNYKESFLLIYLLPILFVFCILFFAKNIFAKIEYSLVFSNDTIVFGSKDVSEDINEVKDANIAESKELLLPTPFVEEPIITRPSNNAIRFEYRILSKDILPGINTPQMTAYLGDKAVFEDCSTPFIDTSSDGMWVESIVAIPEDIDEVNPLAFIPNRNEKLEHVAQITVQNEHSFFYEKVEESIPPISNLTIRNEGDSEYSLSFIPPKIDSNQVFKEYDIRYSNQVITENSDWSSLLRPIFVKIDKISTNVELLKKCEGESVMIIRTQEYIDELYIGIKIISIDGSYSKLVTAKVESI